MEAIVVIETASSLVWQTEEAYSWFVNVFEKKNIDTSHRDPCQTNIKTIKTSPVDARRREPGPIKTETIFVKSNEQPT